MTYTDRLEKERQPMRGEQAVAFLVGAAVSVVILALPAAILGMKHGVEKGL